MLSLSYAVLLTPLHGMMRAYGFLDSEIGKENDFTRKSREGFMAPHIEGTPDTVIAYLTDLFTISGGDDTITHHDATSLISDLLHK